MGRLILGLLCLLAAATPAAAAEPVRLALLIGNSLYEQASPLRNPQNDIGLIASSLQKSGFETTMLANLDAGGLKAAVEDFAAAAAAHERPVVLLYFAGHGVQVEGENYLIPVDAQVSNREAMLAESMAASAVLDRLSGIDASLQIVILDACRDDPFASAVRGLQQGLAETAMPAGKLLAYSTAPGTVALDGNTGNSPYAAALAEAMLIPGLSLDEVMQRVRLAVVERTGGQQEPWETSALYDDFHFQPPTAQVIGETEEEYWNLANMVNSPEAFETYSRLFPEGAFTDLARLRVAALNTEFSFRRRGDTFPVVTGRFFRCPASWGDLFKELGPFDGQTLFFDISMSLEFMYCRGGVVDYGATVAVAPPSGPCLEMWLQSDVFDSDSILCRTPDELPDAPASFRERGGKMVTNTYYRIYLPDGEDSYWRVTGIDGEGYYEQTGLRYRGLARLEIAYEEEHWAFSLHPVDPNQLGLTWKLEATLTEVARWEAEGTPGEEHLRLLTVDPVELRRYAWEPEPDLAGKVTAAEQLGLSSYWSDGTGLYGLRRTGNRRELVHLAGTDGYFGSIYFEGSTFDGTEYMGNAFTTDADCPIVAYYQRGAVAADNRQIVLSGGTPTLGENCEEQYDFERQVVLDWAGSSESGDLAALLARFD